MLACSGSKTEGRESSYWRLSVWRYTKQAASLLLGPVNNAIAIKDYLKLFG